MKYNKIDLTGKAFGRLIVVKEAGCEHGHTLWECKCSCGTVHVVSGQSLRNGATKSCGCLLHDKKPKLETPVNYLLSRYKISAEKRGLCFSLTRQEFVELIQSSCFYCGDWPNQRIHKKKHKDFRYTGVDRRDNTIGYIKTNVVPCCNICNMMKRDLNESVFTEQVMKITATSEIRKGKEIDC